MPEAYVLLNVASWNHFEAKKARRDADNPDLKVPNTARVWFRKDDGTSHTRKMTQAEYRAVRGRDALRHERQDIALSEQALRLGGQRP
jgi:hypothetical protein